MRQTFLGSMVVMLPVCNGTGGDHQTLPDLPGTGPSKTVRKMVSIPAGIDHGQQIRLAGEVSRGQMGAEWQPLPEMQVKPHQFSAAGRTISCWIWTSISPRRHWARI